MDIIISHKSALEYWRLHSGTKINDSAKLRRKRPPASLPGVADIRDRVPPELSYPINLMVSSQNTKRKSAYFQLRLYTSRVPDGCFVSIGDGLAVSAPSFLFFQMAGDLSLINLIELGLELCGSYSSAAKYEYKPGVEAIDKNVYGHPQLTNVKTLRNLAARMDGVSGRKKANRALLYMADGSASPMETILFMLLTLPHKLGGYGLPRPELNRRIDLGKAAGQRASKAYYVCDFLWPEAGLAVEFDSDSYHTGAERIADDSKRRLELSARGIEPITVTNRQIRNIVEFENIANVIAKKLGKRLRYDKSQFMKAHRELRGLLL